MFKTFAISALVAAATVLTPLHAQDLADAEVRRIDKDARKITLRHGPIKNLDMPAMTMVFQVRDAALLDQVAVGDRVKFSAEQQQGNYFVTGIQKAP